MLDELKFVQGAVAKRDFIPTLTHFKIENGAVRSFNGTIALSCPLSLDIECAPKAAPFVKAIANCKDVVTLKMTPKGRLGIKSGMFKAFIDCTAAPTPHVLPEGERIELADGRGFIDALRCLAPIVGDDASKPWATGILFKDQSAFATNNIVLMEYWLGQTLPYVINVPMMAIKELLRIKEPPVAIQCCEKNITFHYEGDRWLRTAVLNTNWPDVEKLLSRQADPAPISDELFEGLEMIAPFADKMGRIYFLKDAMATSVEDEGGAHFALSDMSIQGVYQEKMLTLLRGVAQTADFSKYPAPVPFFGERVRGVITGLKT